MNFSTITTPRLTLRKVDSEVLDYAFAHLNDQELIAFMGIPPEQLNREKERHQKGYTTFNKSFCYFQILSDQPYPIGWCGYHTWYTDHDRAEIGYGLYDEEFKNKGIMSEVLKAVLDFGFHQLKLLRVEAFISPSNVPSIKLVKKFNFVLEGTMRKHYRSNGVMEDSAIYSLLFEEYNP